MTHRARTAFWMVLYFIIPLLPLALALYNLKPGRGLWLNVSVALGFVGLSLLGLQFALAARSRWVTDPLGMDTVLLFHRGITWVILAMVLAHPIILFVIDERFLALLNFSTNPTRAKLGIIAVVAMILLIVVSVWRRVFRLSYSRWQAVHAILAVIIVITAFGHALGVGYYIDEPWEQILWIALTAGFVLMLIWIRIVKPVLRRKRAWEVVSIRSERGDCTTLELKLRDPDSYGPDGFHFQAGQFAWILARKSPFALTFHPFSLSCSAENHDRVAFTIKTMQGFTKELTSLRPGEIVYVDGPFGSFTLDRHPASKIVMIGAGVGVTPLLSMASTIADRHEDVACTIILANRNEASITCYEQLEALKHRMDLTVHHVLSHPAPDWAGESGRLDADKLRRLIPADPTQAEYFICGSAALMDAAEAALRACGARATAIHTERFGMV